ncbi:MAG TPA: TIGR03089 family protein [Nocardioidaceae bacterium]|nr:TIGR03089 family protein [Nocardioidaceae bacterium]
MVTFAAVLADQLRRDPGRPLVTFYDDTTGERIELSVTTYANWVAKTAGLAQDELDLTRGDRVRIDLPTHWLGPVWLGAALSLGLTIVSDGAADLVVCGPGGLEGYADSGPQVVALSLRPMGARFVEPLPQGVLDYGAVVLGMPDAFTAYDPPAADDPAWDTTTHSDLLAAAADAELVLDGHRLLTDVNPCTHFGSATLLGPLQGGGGTAWVANPDPGSWERRQESERATSVLRAG